MREQRLVFQRAAGAGIDAGATTDARAFQKRRPGVRNYPCFVSSIKYLPSKLALYLFADTHAAITDNALRHVDVNIRMRVVE